MGTDPISKNPEMGSVPISGSLDASNSWAVARGASGKPLLANDPHLGLTAPSVWYLAHLEAPGLSAIGGTLPGIPGVLVGRNARIAWGFTNTGPDVQDFYLEKIDTLGNYLAPDGSRPFAIVREEIRVKDEPAEILEVRISRHGPVVSDALPDALDITPRGYALALQWTALSEDDLTMQAALKLAKVGGWREFQAAAVEMHAPQQTITFDDTPTPKGTSASSPLAASRYASRRTTSRAWRPLRGGIPVTTGMATCRLPSCRRFSIRPRAEWSRRITRSCPRIIGTTFPPSGSRPIGRSGSLSCS
jgi:hypothetical protein